MKLTLVVLSAAVYDVALALTLAPEAPHSTLVSLPGGAGGGAGGAGAKGCGAGAPVLGWGVPTSTSSADCPIDTERWLRPMFTNIGLVNTWNPFCGAGPNITPTSRVVALPNDYFRKANFYDDTSSCGRKVIYDVVTRGDLWISEQIYSDFTGRQYGADWPSGGGVMSGVAYRLVDEV